MTDLWLNARVSALENAGPASEAYYFPREEYDADAGPSCIPTLYGSSTRENSPSSNWNTTSFKGTFRISNATADEIDGELLHLAIGNMSMDSLAEDAATHYHFMNSESGIVEYARGRVVGHNRAVPLSNWSSQQYGAFGVRVMFVRNTTNEAVTKPVGRYFSNGYGNTYGGARFSVGTPNVEAVDAFGNPITFMPNPQYPSLSPEGYREYSNTTSVKWNVEVDTADAYERTLTSDVYFPPQKTVILMLTNTWKHWTTFTSGGHNVDRNAFVDLHQLFDDGSLIPDLRMTQAALQANHFNNLKGTVRDTRTQESGGSAAEIYKLCARLFGDR
jgi:hypothetical protein